MQEPDKRRATDTSRSQPPSPRVNVHQLLLLIGFFGLCGGCTFLGVVAYQREALYFLFAAEKWPTVDCSVVGKQWEYSCNNKKIWLNATSWEVNSSCTITGSRVSVAYRWENENGEKQYAVHPILWNFPWSYYKDSPDGKAKTFFHQFAEGHMYSCLYDPNEESKYYKTPIFYLVWTSYKSKVTRQFIIFLCIAGILFLIAMACGIIWYQRRKRLRELEDAQGLLENNPSDELHHLKERRDDDDDDYNDHLHNTDSNQNKNNSDNRNNRNNENTSRHEDDSDSQSSGSWEFSQEESGGMSSSEYAVASSYSDSANVIRDNEDEDTSYS